MQATWQVSFVLKKIGYYTIHVRIQNVAIKNSPFFVYADCAALDVKRTTLQAEWIKHLPVIPCHKQVTIVAETHDAYGNTQRSGGAIEKFKVLVCQQSIAYNKVDDKNDNPDHLIYFNDLQNGKYEINYICYRPGMYEMKIFFDNINLLKPQRGKQDGEQSLKVIVLSGILVIVYCSF